MRIVLVDDNWACLDAMSYVLETLGHTCLRFKHPRTALAAIANAENECDAVITDYAMPEQNGLQLAREIRGLRATLPIVMCSGVVTEEEFCAQGAGECCVFLRKPVEAEELRAVLAKVASGASSVPTGALQKGTPPAGRQKAKSRLGQ